MSAKCGGCPAYADGANCLFCEDGVPCNCLRKRKNLPVLASAPAPEKAKVRNARRAPSPAKEKAEILTKLRPLKLRGFAAHLERRMRQHHEWQQETTAQLVHDFVNIAWVVFQEMDRRHPQGTQTFELEGME
jgi:hypothetical protein